MFVIISSFLIGMGGPLACFILTLLALEPGDEKPHLQDAADIVTWVCRFLPSFCLGKGLFNAINIDVYAFLAGDINLSAWTEPVLLYEVYFLVGQSVFYISLAILLDIWSTNPRALSVWQRFLSFITFSWLTKCGNRADEMAITVALEEDEDVLEEQDRVLRGGANDDLVVLSELTKIYDTGKVAVNNMSLGIHPGECFGLLGINGAGKVRLTRRCA
jgi:ABC-type multidrug transport system fused ATPase/permease subunit